MSQFSLGQFFEKSIRDFILFICWPETVPKELRVSSIVLASSKLALDIRIMSSAKRR